MFGAINESEATILRGQFAGRHVSPEAGVTLPDNTTAAASCVQIARNSADLAISYHADQSIQFVWADSEAEADTAWGAGDYRTKGAEGEIHCRAETKGTCFIRANSGTAGTLSHSRLRA